MADGSVAWVRGIIPDAALREPDDFYPTPPEGTRALLAVEEFRGSIWEPACGDGAMARVLAEAGHRVMATDLVDRGYGDAPVDFLATTGCVADNIVTNPPFKLAEPFALHALSRSRRKVALLARLAWLEGIERSRMFRATPLARVWVFPWRLRIQRGRLPDDSDPGGLIAFAWFVWEHGHTGRPELGWLP